MDYIVNDEINIINSSKIDNNFLINTFITKFNKNYEIIQNIKSEKIDIKNKKWLIHEGTVFENNTSKKINQIEFHSNFDLKKIESLFSNLSSLSIIKLVKLRENYKLLNYSIVEVDMQIYKIITYPIYLTLMTILAAITMFNTKKIKKTTVKITIGLFLSVIIYYIINFFNVMGVTEKISLITAICVPFIMLTMANILMISRINEK